MRHRVEHAIGRGVDDQAATADGRRDRGAQDDATAIGPGKGAQNAGNAGDLGAQGLVDLLAGDVRQFGARILHGGMDYQIRRRVMMFPRQFRYRRLVAHITL